MTVLQGTMELKGGGGGEAGISIDRLGKNRARRIE